MMKILNRSLRSRRIGVSGGAVDFDANGIASVTDEQGAVLLALPGYADAEAAQVDGPVMSAPAAPPAASEVPDMTTVEQEAAAAVAAAEAAAPKKSSKKSKE